MSVEVSKTMKDLEKSARKRNDLAELLQLTFELITMKLKQLKKQHITPEEVLSGKTR